jgi:hypothetical protein
MASDWLKKVQENRKIKLDFRRLDENGVFLSMITNFETNTLLFSEENEIIHKSL